MFSRQPHQAGFTLIELSIVLVIIGLIVGGILVGHDLISAAQLRATISQLEKYNTAVNTFRSKYGYLPGDMPPNIATQFGFYAFGSSCGGGAGTQGCGDGNGLIESVNPINGFATGESLAFWRHLSDANLIDGAFGSSGNSALAANGYPAVAPVTNVSQSLPPAKSGQGAYWVVFSGYDSTAGVPPDTGHNYFELTQVIALNNGIPGWYNALGSALSPIQAYAIDSKIDDGKPNTGNVVDRNGGQVLDMGPWGQAVPTYGYCLIGDSVATVFTDPNDTYNLNDILYGNIPDCTLRFRFN